MFSRERPGWSGAMTYDAITATSMCVLAMRRAFRLPF